MDGSAVGDGSELSGVGSRPKGTRVARGCAELQSRDGLLAAQREWWGSSRASACLQLSEDAVDEVGFGDNRDELHLCAALGAPHRVHLEDFSEETGPGSPTRRGAGTSGVGLWLRLRVGWRGFGCVVLEDAFASSIRIGPIVAGEVLAAVGNRPHSGCFEEIRCPGMTSKLLPPG